MSYNRGMRRDSGRRSGDFGGGGGGGGRRSGNFRGNYDTYGNQMNPWEGGMVPGGSRGGSGLLPAPGQSDLLSQLSTTEAQLALASNLINKIFNQQPTSNVPSLMSLGGLGPGGPGYSSDDYGRNYQDRRRGRLDGGRRAEPYSKPSALNRRLGERRFQNVGKNRNSSDRKAGASVGKSPKKDDKENKKDKDAEKTNGEVDSSQADQSKREGEEGDKESKDESMDEGKDAKDKKSKGGKYQNIPPALLFCHVCSKNMWDESSFLKHLKGRPHQLMMDGLNEKYKLNVDLLRHEMRLAEQQREMELERKHRQGLKVYNHSREYCAMCDLHFYGNLISHRKNMRHQKLKAFLHPKCSHCNKEFSTRLEWDDHRLTPSHLKKVAEYRRATKPDLKDDEFDIDELIAPELVNCGEIISKDVQIVTQQQTEDDIVESKDTSEAKEGTEEKDKEKDKAEGAEEAEKQAQAFRGIDVDPAKLPKYSASVPIGQDLVTNVEGFMCRACNCFMPGDWADTHCRTLTHYNNYCNLVRAKARVSARQKREDQAKEKSLKEKGSKDKLNASLDDEGNWKRRKISKDGEEEEEDQEESVVEDSKEADASTKEEKMEVEEGKNGEEVEIKQEVPESAWEEIDKDIEAAEVKTEEGEGGEENTDGTNESEEVQTVATRGRKGARGNAKGKAKRGK